MKTWDEIDKQTSVITDLIKKLFQEYNALQGFNEAIQWDKNTQEGIVLIQNFQNEINNYLQEQLSVLERLKQERNQSAIFKKVFSSRSNENETKENIKNAELEISSISAFIEKLTEMIDKTPASKSEQKEMAGELRQLKKDLTLQKRELNESLRQTRANARQKNVQWAGVRGAGLLGSAARYSRLSARLEKEHLLVPVEGQKALIEKELISIERDLNWVLHFHDDGLNVPQQIPQTVINHENIQVCPYCGRKVTSEICSSCGAVIPLVE